MQILTGEKELQVQQWKLYINQRKPRPRFHSTQTKDY